jgi:hypothetical protein
MTRSYTLTTPAGTSRFEGTAGFYRRSEYLDYLGVAFSDVRVGALDGLAGMAEVNGVEVSWGVDVIPA